MTQNDRIESFIEGLYRNGKDCYSKAEILEAARNEIKDTEGYRFYFEQLPDHEYDQRTLTNAIASLRARIG